MLGLAYSEGKFSVCCIGSRDNVYNSNPFWIGIPNLYIHVFAKSTTVLKRDFTGKLSFIIAYMNENRNVYRGQLQNQLRSSTRVHLS